VAAALAAALAAGRPIATRSGSDGDSLAAALIIEHTLRSYLGRGLTVAGPHDPLPADAFVIILGSAGAASDDGIELAVWETPHVSFSVGVQAWRLGQLLLMAYEREPDLPLVALDLETGDRHPQTAEVVEIGALRLGDAGPGERAFARLVRPSSPAAITKRAAEINGIAWSMVADQPDAAAVMPELLSFLGDAVLVGHGIEDFDYPILRRLAREHAGVEPRHLLIDTYKMAQRVMPGERSYRLAHLIQHVEPGGRQDHRALGDLMLTARLFDYLRAQHRAQLELDVLTEALPLVAVSLRAAGLAIRHDTALLTQLGARAAAFGQGAALRQSWRQRVEPDLAAASEAWLAAQPAESPADDQTWAMMEESWRTALDVYAQHGVDTSLAGFLRYAALAEPIDLVPLVDGPATADDDPRRLGGQERVTLMTVHAAKGLEWPLVFLLGVEDDQFPHYLSRAEAKLAEERRLLYVGLTRARRRLCLLWSGTVNGHERHLSPFLTSLPPEVLTHRPRRRMELE
jgi:DNA polymerase III epsilon subunit-like protein